MTTVAVQAFLKSFDGYGGGMSDMRHAGWISALALCLIAQPAQASSSTGTISVIHGMQNGVILFHMSQNRPGFPSCATNTPSRWAFNAATPAGQARLSILLTAYAAGKSIYIAGTGTCGDWGDTESVDYFYIAN